MKLPFPPLPFPAQSQRSVDHVISDDGPVPVRISLQLSGFMLPASASQHPHARPIREPEITDGKSIFA